MKKIVFFLVMTVLFVACAKKEENSIVVPETIISLGIDVPQTKTDLQGTVDVVWSTGDQVSISTNQGMKTFTLIGEGGSKTGDFKCNEVVEVTGGAFGATSFYPASMSPNYDEGWHITLPSEYAWSENGVKAPMYSWLNKSEGKWDYFRLLTSVLKVDVYNIPADACKLVFTTVDQKVSGDFLFDAPYYLSTSADDVNNKITINFSGSLTSRTFFIPVPVGTYVAGATIELKDYTDNVLMTKTAPALTVQANTISYLPAISYVASGTRSKTVYKGNFYLGNNYQEPFTALGYRSDRIWDGVVAGTVVRICYTTTDGGAGFDMYYIEESKWTKLSDNDHNWAYQSVAGDYEHTYTLAEEDLTGLRVLNTYSQNYGLGISGKNVTIKQVDLEVLENPYRPEQVLWIGNVELGRNGSWSVNMDEIPKSFWAKLSEGKIISIYFDEIEQSQGWRALQLQHKEGTWKTIASLGYNANGSCVFEYTLTEADITNLSTYGGVINGSGLALRKVTVR